MKKYYIVFVTTLVAAFLGSCKLDVDDEERLPGDKFWIEGTAANMEGYCLSIYNHLRNAVIQKSGFYYVSGDLRCAPVTAFSNNSFEKAMADNDMKSAKNLGDKSEEGKSRNFGMIYNWTTFYQVIQSANIMIKEVDNVPALTNKEKSSYKAECVFLRNLSYFYLVRLFGDVPYFTEAYYAQPLQRTSMVTVLQNCLNDMQAVLDADPDGSILPWRSFTVKRANRGAMVLLMMHVNMWLAQFDNENRAVYYGNVKTLAEMDSWIDRTDYFTLPSIEESSEIFNGGSFESIFEIAQNITSGEVFPTDYMWSTYVVSEVRNKEKPEWQYDPLFIEQLYPAEETDRRKELWFSMDGVEGLRYDKNGKLLTEITTTSEDGGSTATTEIFVEITKFLNPDTGGSSLVINSGNYIVFRLSDAILLYAEALNQLGETDKAMQEVNRIRARASASLLSDSSSLDGDIYWERVRELMGEGQYFYDLVRTGKLCEESYTLFGKGGHREKRANFNQGSWTWPIFKGALNSNPYMTKNQYWE